MTCGRTRAGLRPFWPRCHRKPCKKRKLVEGSSRYSEEGREGARHRRTHGLCRCLEADGKDNCRVWLIEHLGAERKNDARKLHRAITSHANSVRSGLKSASARLEKILCANGDKKTCDPIEAMAQATASALKLESKLFDPAHLSRNNLHPYRLKVKELHNVLRTGVNSTHHEFVETLNSVKDSIGEWHDWEELLATAKKELDHANCKLIRELKSTADRKYAEALAQAESMRKKYLQIDRGRKSLRKKKALQNLHGRPQGQWQRRRTRMMFVLSASWQ